MSIEGLLGWFSQAVEGGGVLGFGAAALLGVASVLLSPCHLASVPLVVSVVSRRTPGRRPLHGALLFAVGVLASFVVVGAVTVAAGRIAGDLGAWATWAGAALFIALGLDTLGLVSLPWVRPATASPRLHGAPPALIGFAFGATLGPCSFAFMAPVLGSAYGLADTEPVAAAGLVAAFALAHSLLLALAGGTGEWTLRFLAHREASRVVSVLRGVMGVSMVGAGLYLVAFGR